MYEKILPPSSHEKILDEDIGELTVSQMNDIVTTPEYNLYPEDGTYSEEQSKRLSDWVKENSDSLEDILTDIGYYPEELAEANISRLKLCLMTPRFIYAQDKRDHGNDKTTAHELTEYREVLRHAVQADPDIQAKDLKLALHGAVMWANLPDTYRYSSSGIIERAVSGVSAELVMKQLALSKVAQAAGIEYEDTSAEEDASGIDLRLTVPVQRISEVTPVSMGVDVKFNRKQIIDILDLNEEIKPYKITNGKVVMWPGVTKEDLKGRLMLDDASAERKGAALVPFLQRAAEEFRANEYHHRKIRENIGRRSLRSA